jgi:diketogulonate reductase-like aldo/keto reductase
VRSLRRLASLRDLTTYPRTATKVASQTHGYETTKKSIDESLAKFGFGASALLYSVHITALLCGGHADYVDLFLIHDPLSGPEKRMESYKALLEGKAAKKIRDVGVSN